MRLAPALLLLLLLTSLNAVPPETPAPVPAAPPGAAEKRVLIVTIDGLRPDLLLRADAPNARRLMESGCYTFWARTVPECYTLPAHLSLLTGVSPQKHGVEWNDHIEEAYALVPTLFELAKAAGLTTAAVSGKTKFIVLNEPGALDWVDLPYDEPVPDGDVAHKGAAMLREHRPHVLFVHLAGVDTVGHEHGWGSHKHMAAVSEADAALGVVLGALDDAGLTDSTLVILTADHGGAGREHGPDDPRSRYVPWVVAGPGVREDSDLTLFEDLTVDAVDTFATACDFLGIEVPDGTEGEAVWQIREDHVELLYDAGAPAAPAAAQDAD